MALAEGRSYVAFASLAEAKADPDGVVILEGDDGGQIYVVARAEDVSCSPAALDQLLRDLDLINWEGNEGLRSRGLRAQSGRHRNRWRDGRGDRDS